MTIDLESLQNIPEIFINRLKSFEKLFIKNNYLEKFEHEVEMHQLIVELNNFCLKNFIYGYHYTNACVEDIKNKGLTLRSGKEIRETFRQNYFNLFTEEEQKIIIKNWATQFDESDIENRDNQIFFNFTKQGLKDGGAIPLLTYYGGEQVYFPLYRLSHIGQKLRNIGKPLILKCILNPNKINTYFEYPWGKIIVSSFHRKFNKSACVEDQDGYQYVKVEPENIEIIEYNLK